MKLLESRILIAVLEAESSFNAVVSTLLLLDWTFSGTSPSLTPTLEGSADGTSWYPIHAGTAITAVSKQRIVAARHGIRDRTRNPNLIFPGQVLRLPTR